MNLETRCIDTIRCLAIDAIEKANSGHPGAPMTLAPAAYALWMNIMRFNPKNPNWFNRDRFVLSNGHASMLQYAMLHLCGYDLSLDDIKQFRQLGSKTAGHPEHHLTPGVETTTGPLGQGVMAAVGMAIAEAHLAAIFNVEGKRIVDHRTFVFCGDGDLMEGASHEAASLAGHLGLGKLIFLYDNNHITIEGHTNLTYDDDVAKRFEAYNWHVLKLDDEGVAQDVGKITQAFQAAIAVDDKPSIIILRSLIGYGSPNKQDTSAVHGSPLGAAELKLTKEFYGWPLAPEFLVPDEVKEFMGRAVTAGAAAESRWNELLQELHTTHPDLGTSFQQYLNQELPLGWADQLPIYSPSDGAVATRKVSTDVLHAVSKQFPWLIGGSADLGESTATFNEQSGYLSKAAYQNRNIDWGIREHVMCAASYGMMVHGGVRPYAATYFVFTDYAKPAIRIAAIMKMPVIYIMTHDSIGLGEDGTTHQPIEQLITFRATPNIATIRPADANEAVEAWKAALERKDGPTMLVLTRQKVPVLDRSKYAGATGLHKGAYILSKEKGISPQAIVMSTGSEVQWALQAQELLWQEGIDIRVVSMPCWKFFRTQSKSYHEEVLPKAVKARVAIEAAAPEGWHEWVGADGIVIGMSTFGESAPAQDLFKHFGFTAEHVVAQVKNVLAF
ncbi:MAG: transketolase [Bacteroidetes bacterium]|nr:transketolase [Bacteroidota bacterium]